MSQPQPSEEAQVAETLPTPADDTVPPAKEKAAAADIKETSPVSGEPSGKKSRPEKPKSELEQDSPDGNSDSQAENSDRDRSPRRPRNRSNKKKGARRRGDRQSGENRDSDRDESRRDSNDDEESTSEGTSQGGDNDGPPRKTRKQRYLERKEKERAREAAALEASPAVESEGIVEISSKGFGFLREKKRGFQQSPKDVFITPEVVRTYGLRDGLMVKCVSKQGVRGPQLIELLQINGREPKDYVNLPYFEELTAINPDKKLTLETDPARKTTRVIDLMAPIGRGQRGLIVAPPRTGKTTLLHHIAEGIQKNYDEEIHLMVLLVDERPEEVTDFERSFPGVEVFSSSNDSDAKDHTRMALLAIERAKRLVEAGEHVFILMDSITRLARAFNSQMRGGSKRGTASGGLLVGALEIPRRIFAAARNTREAGSLTIVATALIQTNSKADEAIFQEFKGTGNMELVLDRQIAQNYVYPAVDINKSGTRREELLLPPHVLEKIYVIRRGLSGYKQLDAMEWLLKCMERYPSNAQMLMDIKTTALS
ncbi:MAG: transcription termination factor Rho [Verrucomicrobiales bacterium]|nr:transcription termination factor Rho [Verrucomicrobiales bacterium]